MSFLIIHFQYNSRNICIVALASLVFFLMKCVHAKGQLRRVVFSKILNGDIILWATESVRVVSLSCT